MNAERFVKLYPRLYHMATADALGQIERYGLLSSQATLELINMEVEERDRLLSQRRPQCVVLNSSEHGKFVLRDQKPLRDAALEKCLSDMKVADFYRLLNERTFLWATRKRVETLLAARSYKKSDQLILTIDTKELLKVHEDDIELSSINSGATLYAKPPVRGKNTFCRLVDYEAHNGNREIIEVTVKGSIPKIKAFIVETEVRKAVA